ncbi:MAG: M20/M25/M40 family metallo-hydrolase, partial [Sandaracinaceae bacterium]|nr:M20/M25/M40 family metallo-hydrolase [Sandaracinaceae bacterium]
MGFAGFTREGDVARGPGVLDMKSGLTSVLFALRALRRASPERFAALRARFVCVSDEEVGSPSSAPLFATLAPRTTAALVFEAGRE